MKQALRTTPPELRRRTEANAETARQELQAGHPLPVHGPGIRHGLVVTAVVGLLLEFLRFRREGHVIAGNAGFRLASAPDTVRRPDVAFLTRGRFDEAGAGQGTFPGAPDLAIEVVSSSDSPGETHARVADYLAAGARAVWVVDPGLERVIVFRSLLSPRTLGRDDRLDGQDVLPGLSVPVSRLFRF